MDLIKLMIDENYRLSLSVHYIVIIISLIVFLLWFAYSVSQFRTLNDIEIDCVELGIRGQKIKIKPNCINIDIAYKIWVELNTRKIGLPIDLDNDVIIEIYDSWYQFFGETRALLKSLPANKIRNDESTKELIDISTKILNEGLRPHLTKWQAVFRKWYQSQLNDNINLTPQEIQKNFHKYTDLSNDLLRVNLYMVHYKEHVRKLAFGK